ncbi:hypothetical protein BHE74_00033115 [Ensete ventricosum]|nr:hypothetical protein BHE74_00033115 [Ensete ventricosum]RZS27104.1 hypothetical protein BHM03_00060537 [Ensete ventricosum]
MGNRYLVSIFAAHVMYPLRFPNSGIKAKAARKEEAGHGQATCSGGQPRPCPLQGRSAMAKPLAMAVGCGQGPLRRGSRLQVVGPPAGETHWQLQSPVARRPPVAAAAYGHNARGRAYGLGGRARRRRQPIWAASRGQQRPTAGKGGH